MSKRRKICVTLTQAEWSGLAWLTSIADAYVEDWDRLTDWSPETWSGHAAGHRAFEKIKSAWYADADRRGKRNPPTTARHTASTVTPADA